MAASDQRNKWKCEELATALSGSKKLSALGFVINPNKRTRQRLSHSLKLRNIGWSRFYITLRSESQSSESTNIRRRHHYGFEFKKWTT